MSTCNSEEATGLAETRTEALAVREGAPTTAPAGAGLTAPTPYPPRERNLSFLLRQYLRMVKVMMTEYRETWWVHAVFGFMFPLGMIFFLKSAGGTLTPERAIFLVGGNMTTSIAYGPTMILINRIGWGRHYRSFDYWTSLPAPKLALLFSMVTVALALSFPGILGVYLLGSLMLGLPPSGGLALLLLVPLGALSLCGFGAFIGAYARDGQSANVLSNIFLGVVTFLSPLMIPPEAMPAILRLTARFIPTTYVAEAFRAALRGVYDTGFAVNVALLVLFAVGFLWLVQQKLDWRSA
jgi:ABC-2 type transport system permease protein